MSVLNGTTDQFTECRDPDIALMLRVQSEEPGAFAELIDRFWSPLFGRFFRQFGDRQEAEDLVQDVFLRLFRNRKRYQPQAKFSTWLFHIARNVARNAIRTRQRRPVTPITLLESTDESPVSHRLACKSEMPDRSLERVEIAGIVRHAMGSLKGRQRTAIELQCLDHSYGEIADVLDMTAKAAKSLLYRARNQLRETLSPKIESLTA